MPGTPRRLTLTAELVARAHRPVEYSGLPPGYRLAEESDWRAIVSEILAARPAGQDVWIFAYGSLLWNPAIEHSEERIAIARGWHRSFRIRLPVWRGTLAEPGLMMGLDRGGACKAVACRLEEETVEAEILKLVRRELPVKAHGKLPTNVPRWIGIETPRGDIRAIAYVMDPMGHSYTGRLTLEETADILARACGHGGSCAEYLYSTVSHLEARGIRDRNLWRLQALVAARLAAQPGRDTAEI